MKIYLLAFALLAPPWAGAETNASTNERDAKPVEEIRVCKRFYTPFKEKNRRKYKSIMKRLVSRYGAYRNTLIVGHKHAGIDLRTYLRQRIYAIGVGKVVYMHISHPHFTVFVKHWLPDGTIIYSSYKHITTLRVNIGDWVTHRTVLARAYDKGEYEDSGYPVNHLHFEMRTSIDDMGEASSSSMTMEELDKHCMDPLEFFKEHLE